MSKLFIQEIIAKRMKRFFEFENVMKAQSKSDGASEREYSKEQMKIEIEKLIDKYESIQYIENEAAYLKFIKLAEYADDIAKAMGWFVAVEMYNKHIGVISFMTDLVCFLGLDDERTKFESMLGLADEYYIMNNKYDSDLIEIEIYIDVCCAVTDETQKRLV